MFVPETGAWPAISRKRGRNNTLSPSPRQAGSAGASQRDDAGSRGTAPGTAGCASGTDGTAVGIGGKSVAAGARAGADATAGGGRDSFCHASHNMSAENEKTTNRMRRWVSMTARVTARGGKTRGG